MPRNYLRLNEKSKYMGKPSIGVICTPRGSPNEKYLFSLLGKRFALVLFPVQKDVEYEILKKQAKNVHIILNTAGDMPYIYDSEEMTKTFENMGKHVIDSSKSFYYGEEKWLFYQICKKNDLPTPETYYIPHDISWMRLRALLKKGPVVFKGIFSDTGHAVKRAMNFEEAARVIKELRKKIGLMPVVAQRYIPHGKVSYRVTLAGDRIIQAITKYGKNWKEGKLFAKNERYRLFKPDKNLAKLCKKTSHTFKLEWCGIDLLKDGKGKWYIIEVNSCPSMDFVLSDAKRTSNELLNYILSLHNKMMK